MKYPNPTYRGKIGTMSLALRNEVCQRLQAGQLGPEILAWLNSLDEVRAHVARFGGEPVNAQNLSDWRRGGYQHWSEHNDRLTRVSKLAEKAVELARVSGGSLTEGAAAIAAGRILEMFEAADERTTPEALGEMMKPLVALRSGDQQSLRLAQAERDLARRGEELALAQEKFRRSTAETVLTSARDAAVQAIAASPLDHTAQLEAVGKHLFGDLWK